MKARMSARFLAVALFAMFCVASAVAQDNAKWTGTWKMIPSTSKFGDSGGPSNIVIKLELKDTTLTETLTVGSDNGERSFTAKYTTDGKESTQEVMGRSAQTTAKWEGEALVIDFKAEGRGFRRKITLTPDGKTMTIAVHHSGDQGERDETVVLEKQ
jgi:hypothetical protein